MRSSADLVFYNQPIALSGSVHLRDKVRPDLESGETAAAWCSDVVTLELDNFPEEIERVVVAASLDPSTGETFGDAEALRMRIQRTSDATDLLVFDIADTSNELALVFGEFYRRDTEWKIRAIGQGYAEGLAALVVDYGVEVNPDDDAVEVDEEIRANDEAVPSSPPPSDEEAEVAPPLADQDSDQASSQAEGGSRGVSVRRPNRAPRLPADWDRTIPAEDGNDWQVARLFPVAGIGAGEEQERRATSALLAVMSMVREFGAALPRFAGPREDDWPASLKFRSARTRRPTARTVSFK